LPERLEAGSPASSARRCVMKEIISFKGVISFFVLWVCFASLLM
jgi:hypothetical protein